MHSQTSEAIKTTPPLSQITDSLDKAMEQNRELLSEMTRFTKEETFRFANRRLERTEQAVEQIHGCRGISGLFNAQHEWLRDLMQDYTDQSLRYAELFRTLGQNAQSHVRAVAGEMSEKVRAEMEEAGHDAQHAADEASSVNGQVSAGGEIYRQGDAPYQPH